jgi:hypothetical protein
MDPIIDTYLARSLGEAKASGAAPPKGSPERLALERAAKRVDPKGAIQKEIRADYQERVNRGTSGSDPLTDARIAARIRRAFSPVASAAVKERAAKSDPALAANIAAAESTRAATRAELVRALPTQAAKAIADMSSETETDLCPVCEGKGYVDPVATVDGLTPAANPCLGCEGLGLVPTPDPDDDNAVAAAVAKARDIRRLARKLVKKAGGRDARTMAKSSAAAGHGTVLAIDESRKAKALSPRERQILRREAAKRLGIPADRLTVKVQ